MATDETLLVITGVSIAPYSARGLQQTLAPIEQIKQPARTVNGKLIDISLEQFRKYTTQISCSDMRAPALNGVWPGLQITVDCITELSYLTSGGSAEKTVVPGSSRVEGDYTYYRPRLICRVQDYSEQLGEYEQVVGWTLTAEEI